MTKLLLLLALGQVVAIGNGCDRCGISIRRYSLRSPRTSWL